MNFSQALSCNRAFICKLHDTLNVNHLTSLNQNSLYGGPVLELCVKCQNVLEQLLFYLVLQ